MTGPARAQNPTTGIAFILLGVLAISVNDMLIKFLSGGYPLHQMVFTRSATGIAFSLILVQIEGGWGILRTDTPFLHALRGLLIVVANMSFFAALAVLPLAEATAVFFCAPLMITLLSIPLLGEKVGPLRIGAVVVGLLGVVVMTRPWADQGTRDVPIAIYLLPVLAALTYALNQVLTRKLGVKSRASAMAVYIQFAFILASAAFWLVAGDGRFAAGVDNESLVFLLRAWVWPEERDVYLFLGLGLNSAIIGYSLSQAYRVADAATVAPFEYVGLPLAIFWGWAVWGELPGPVVLSGIALILGAGIFVFLRERQKKHPIVSRRRIHRRY
ncbi:MAG TPA: DMT family transporter [Roseovarius sp.]|nr:DMT family transporter [Roseovarius sp.]